jgi:tetratricopeptide (TPR) repeat protein
MNQSQEINKKPDKKIDVDNIDPKKGIAVCSKAIDHDPELSFLFYQLRGIFYLKLKDYDNALADINKVIELSPNNMDNYKFKYEIYFEKGDYEQALKEIEKVGDHNEKFIKNFLEGPLKELSLAILLPGYYSEEENLFLEGYPAKVLKPFIEKAYDTMVKKHPHLPDGYLHRGIYFMAQEKYEHAKKNFTKYIKLNPDDVFIIFLRGICYYEIFESAKADEDFKRITENQRLGNLNLIKNNIENQPLLNNTIDYSRFLAIAGLKFSVENMIKSLDIFLNIFKSPDREVGGHPEENILNLASYIDQLNFDENRIPNDLESLLKKIFFYYPEFNNNSLEDLLKRDGKEIFYINVKLCYLKYIARILIDKKLPDVYEDIPYEWSKSFFQKIPEKNINKQYNLSHTFMNLSEELQRQLIEINKTKTQELVDARVEERNKILADLSHSIKNLISTVIDPLENLKEEKIVKPAVIQNALRGANLVREIVNAMNLSFKGSIEDFRHDVINNTGKGKMDLQSIIVESLIYSIGNMFDGKYFSNFMRQYFPSKDIFKEAKPEWIRISQSSELSEIIIFLEKYFFEIDLSFVDAAKYVIGNEKGSAIKLLILFQELIVNAVKYSGFVNKEKRFLHIRFSSGPKEISIKVENRCKEKVRVKTSGIGHVIIENFAKLLETAPTIEKNGDIYAVEIKFENFWGK